VARIRAEDIAEVRERARIDEVVGQTVALKPAGGGSLKGLCPFHDERSPSFQVSPAKGLWYCFGCGEGGDTIDFVMRTEALSFAEAIERLAEKYRVELRYEEGTSVPHRQGGQRTRLLQANAAAAAFFVDALQSAEAQIGRDFLTGRGFDAAAAEHFGVGFAPRSWDALTGHLRRAGFNDAELLAAGLVAQRDRGVYDRFRGRLVWPIRELSGEVVGFGARKLHDDDQGPKYLNTPETALYKKSHVLYGVDLARKSIGNAHRAVIVEGYTDVMACHLAGVTGAVATCGTAFGEGHVKVLRRLLMDDNATGEVIFTFDGDAAGQRAAMRAFETDQAFVAQTFVAVQPDGLDPCDLRLSGGDEAVRALVDGRVPMFEFAIRSTLATFDLTTAEGQVAALRATAPMLRSMRDVSLRDTYVRRLAGWLGLDAAAVQRQVRQGPGGSAGAARPMPRGDVRVPAVSGGDVDTRVERLALQVMLQLPVELQDWIALTEETAFTDAACAAVFRAVRAAGPAAEGGERGWLDEVLAQAENDQVRSEVRRWAVLGLPVAGDADPTPYAEGVMARLASLDVGRRIGLLKGRLARMGAQETPEAVADVLRQLMVLEAYRREMLELAMGEVWASGQ